MIAITALALALSIGPGPDFSEAYDRAKGYVSDKAASSFASDVFSPKVYDQLDRVTAACRTKPHPANGPGFIIVVAYRDGKADHVFLDRETPYSRCIAEGMSKFAYPDSPVRDFAQDYEFGD